MYYYKATIQYDGTGYAGFQWQKDIPSVQNDFNQAVQSLIPGKLTTMGASRTDTGVHAMVQVVKVTSEIPIPFSTFLVPLNEALPPQIRCLDFTFCTGDFRPASDPISKEYRYYFTNKRNVSTDESRFIANFSLPLDMESMMLCIQKIIGIQDFQNFCSAGSNVKSTVREISVCELSVVNPQAILSQTGFFNLPSDLEQCYQFRIKGNGFLKQMIRHLVSALWMVGSKKLTVEDFSNLLHGPKWDKRIWKVAAPNGLFLHEINYPTSRDFKDN